MINPCIIIPVYNHEKYIAQTVAQLAPFKLPCILVDDGSDAECRATLQELTVRHVWVSLVSLAENAGKGGAVMAGLRDAWRQGYSHGLQIDADGQHNLTDIPRFIDASRRCPDALIAGRPIFDETVPKARLYGRYLTHVFVWLETLSFDIKDAMCGFRIYPLQQTLSVIDRAPRIGKRMDFDPEIMVRLFWAQVPLKTIATRVIYDVEGISHFNVIHDNMLITRMHTRLTLGMIWRAPGLLTRKWQKKS